jgi:hypothetical protein
MAVVSNMPDVAWQNGRLARGIVSLLERRFQHEKAAPKLLNRAHSALFFS